MGVDAETDVFMLLYLDLAYKKAREDGRLRSLADLQEAIREGAVKRIRPKFDGRVHVPRIGSHSMVHRHRRGRHEANRCAHGRWHLYFVPSGTLGYPAVYEAWK